MQAGGYDHNYNLQMTANRRKWHGQEVRRPVLKWKYGQILYSAENRAIVGNGKKRYYDIDIFEEKAGAL